MSRQQIIQNKWHKEYVPSNAEECSLIKFSRYCQFYKETILMYTPTCIISFSFQPFWYNGKVSHYHFAFLWQKMKLSNFLCIYQPVGCPLFWNLFLIGEWLYNIVLVSALHRHGSALGVYMSSSSWASLPPPTPSHPSQVVTGHLILAPRVTQQIPNASQLDLLLQGMFIQIFYPFLILRFIVCLYWFIRALYIFTLWVLDQTYVL